ncbi:MAG: hypothetical protein HY506_01235 [Candidatus Yanofskybacteria bacterium]|nr:hypothetical protein [Candidatus Yanofskybacteria bacterium]
MKHALLFWLLLFSPTLPRLMPEDGAKFKAMERELIFGNEAEKESSWQKFIKSTPRNTTDDGEPRGLIGFLMAIIETGTEPYKKLAWDEIRSRNLRKFYTECDIFVNGVMEFTEPYKSFAWDELTKCDMPDLAQAYSHILIKGSEPYRLWAWQNLENSWSASANSDKETTNHILMEITLFAEETYQGWAWNQLFNNQADISIVCKVLFVWPYPEPYAGMAWALISNLKTEQINKKTVNLLKRIANESKTNYKVAALSKLLTLPLATEDREIAAKMYDQFSLALEKERTGGSFAIVYRDFDIEDDTN